MNHKITLLEGDDPDADYEMPDEIDFSKVTPIRRGLPPSHPLANAAPATVELAPDVAAVFHSSEAVNEALRAIIRAMEVANTHKLAA